MPTSSGSRASPRTPSPASANVVLIGSPMPLEVVGPARLRYPDRGGRGAQQHAGPQRGERRRLRHRHGRPRRRHGRRRGRRRHDRRRRPAPSRLELARELGATHVVNAREQDPVEAIRGRHRKRRRLQPRDERGAGGAAAGGGLPHPDRGLRRDRRPRLRHRGGARRHTRS